MNSKNFSPAADVLVLALRRAPLLSKNTMFICIGSRGREMPLQPLYEALGPLKAEALPGLYALSGPDVTGDFKGKAEISFWNKFLEGTPLHFRHWLLWVKTKHKVTDFEQIEAFVCSLYSASKLCFKSLAIQRCHYQCIEWNRDAQTQPNLPPPAEYGWR
uniref:Uncharacterized protein n=1 Tax=Photinus pyralis TaxID=7054 RepID=A0A1Y1L134_PHOPY